MRQGFFAEGQDETGNGCAATSKSGEAGDSRKEAGRAEDGRILRRVSKEGFGSGSWASGM
jgi:hypothetical protein